MNRPEQGRKDGLWVNNQEQGKKLERNIKEENCDGKRRRRKKI